MPFRRSKKKRRLLAPLKEDKSAVLSLLKQFLGKSTDLAVEVLKFCQVCESCKQSVNTRYFPAVNICAFIDTAQNKAKFSDRYLCSDCIKSMPENALLLSEICYKHTCKHSDMDLELIKFMLDSNCDPNKGWKGMFPISRCSNPKVAKLLVENGAQLEGREHLGHTPLTNAVLARNKECVEFLIKAKADVEARTHVGWSPLYFAINDKNSEIVNLLINGDADVNFANNENRCSCLHRAVFDLNHSFVEALISNRANVNAEDALGRTPIDFLRFKESDFRAQIIAKLLLENSANISEELTKKLDLSKLMNSTFRNKAQM